MKEPLLSKDEKLQLYVHQLAKNKIREAILEDEIDNCEEDLAELRSYLNALEKNIHELVEFNWAKCCLCCVYSSRESCGDPDKGITNMKCKLTSLDTTDICTCNHFESHEGRDVSSQDSD